MSVMKTAVILQSSYIPWKGYFDLIRLADEFILLDDVQYTVRDWRNRNVIKTHQGLHYLTIPVYTKGRRQQRICDVVVSDLSWAASHWKALQASYARAAHFREIEAVFKPLYLNLQERSLSRINHCFIRAICGYLGIQTPVRWSMDFQGISSQKTQRLVDLCLAVGATRYLSGPSAQAYLDEPLFKKTGIELAFMNYDGYQPYQQLHGKFEHHVSILDLLVHEGPNARRYMKSLSTRHGDRDAVD